MTIYVQPDCPGCANVKAFLERNGVLYVERDISADEDAQAEFRRIGYPATPVTIVGTHRILGFNRKALGVALGFPERR